VLEAGVKCFQGILLEYISSTAKGYMKCLSHSTAALGYEKVFCVWGEMLWISEEYATSTCTVLYIPIAE
jgi:hypothetical protein